MCYRPKPLSAAIALALIVGTAPALVLSSEIPQRGPMTFKAFDGDGDGVVTEQEFASARAERMQARAAQGAPMAGAGSAPAFSDLDADGDGRLTPAEFEAWRRARMGGGPGMGPGAGRGMGPGGMGRGPGRHMPSFDEFDLDGDGVLREQEFYQARTQRMSERAQQNYPMRNAPNAPEFGDLDADGDGRVTPEEFAAAQAEQRRRMAPRP